MTFPFYYRAEIHAPDLGSARNLFLTLMPLELRGIGLQNVTVQGDRILFGSGTPRYFSDWNLLTALDSGNINVFANGGKLTVTYSLSFTRFFALMGTLFVFALTLWTITAHPSIQSLIVGALLLLVWLLFMGLSCWHVARRLGAVIKNVLARSI